MNSDLEFAFTIGTIDGIITALMIASRAILSDIEMPLSLAVRIAVGSSVVGAASYLVAEYGKLRAEDSLVYKHLRPQGSRRVRNEVNMELFLDAFKGGGVSMLMGFVGASIPLLSYSILNRTPYISIIVSYITLIALGIILGKKSGGKISSWAGSLILLGILMTILGYYVQVIS
ncbi:hypothetical protein ACNF42_00260 [Cuniculiplasma sp. SKW3]|uniref:hypothetical protein n=1 Tax=Cuniculiplasma sp. SKW3 TaxID=3400170 RepID=UPI003FD25901